MLIRTMLIQMLEELGHRVISEAGSIEEAMPLARTAEFDLALLDVILRGEMITPVAEIIQARERPLILLHGLYR